MFKIKLQSILFTIILAFIFTACNDDEPEVAFPTSQEIEASNVTIVKQFYNALINDNDDQAILNILDSNFYDNDAIPNQVQSPQGKLNQIKGFFNVFPNAQVDTEKDQMYISMGDFVAVYSNLNWKIEGQGFFGIQPSGQDIKLNAIDIWEVKNSRITQTWHTENFADVAAFQLGETFCPNGQTFHLNRSLTTRFPEGNMQVPGTNYDQLSSEEKGNLSLVQKHYKNLLIDFDFTAARENITDNFNDNNALPGEVGPDLEIQFLQGFLASFKDVKLDITKQWFIVQGDLVLAHTVFETPYNGQQPFFGLPVTNSNVSIVASDIWRLENGKIAEGWHVENLIDVAFQAGGVLCP